MEKRVKDEGRKEIVGDKDVGNGISREEGKEGIARMKRNKATGENGLFELCARGEYVLGANSRC